MVRLRVIVLAIPRSRACAPAILTPYSATNNFIYVIGPSNEMHEPPYLPYQDKAPKANAKHHETAT